MATQLEKTAYHEAGHVVAAVELGIPFEPVSIADDDGGLRAGWPITEPSDENRELILKMIFFALAGCSAQAVLTGEDDHDSAAGDFEYAEIWVSRLNLGEAYILETLERCKAWALTYSPKIERVAAALLKQRTLSPNDVRQILSN